MKRSPYRFTPSEGELGFFRSAYGSERVRPTVICTVDMARQEFKEECDINVIMRQYEATGIVDHLNRLSPQWGEVPSFDFRESMEMVREAQEKFDALPSRVRERFGNDPHQMMLFLGDEDNRAEGEKLGLLTPRPSAPVPEAVAPSAKPG